MKRTSNNDNNEPLSGRASKQTKSKAANESESKAEVPNPSGNNGQCWMTAAAFELFRTVALNGVVLEDVNRDNLLPFEHDLVNSDDDEDIIHCYFVYPPWMTQCNYVCVECRALLEVGGWCKHKCSGKIKKFKENSQAGWVSKKVATMRQRPMSIVNLIKGRANARVVFVPPIPPRKDPKAKHTFIGCLYCCSVMKPNTMRSHLCYDIKNEKVTSSNVKSVVKWARY